MSRKYKSDMSDYLKIEDRDSLIKDMKTSSIISIDESAYEAALHRKNRAKRFQQMEKDVSELKILMSTLIQKLDK